MFSNSVAAGLGLLKLWLGARVGELGVGSYGLGQRPERNGTQRFSVLIDL